MNNGIVLYCDRYGRASFWDICKAKRCSSACLFSKIVEKFSRDDFFSTTTRRYTSLEEFEKDLEAFTTPPPVERKSVTQASLPQSPPTRVKPAPPSSASKGEMVDYGDLTRKALIEAVKEAR